MGYGYKDREQQQEDESDNTEGALFEIPAIGGVMQGLDSALKKREELAVAHSEENEKDKAKGKKRQRPKGVICCCGDPSCGIGPMAEIG